MTHYWDCFALTLSKLGCAKNVKMEVHLQEEEPIIFKPFRMAVSKNEKINEIINQLVNANIIQEWNSNIASPIVLVRTIERKDYTSTITIDFLIRLQSNYWSITRGGQVMEYFTSLDLKSEYHQIPIEKKSRHYTSFVIPSTQNEYLRMPFGLTNTLWVFQRYMNNLLKLVFNIAAVYLDDVYYILLHKNKLYVIRKNFWGLYGQKIWLWTSTSVLFSNKLYYIGFEVSNKTIHPGLDKIQAVINFTPPKNDTQIRLTGYFWGISRENAVNF